MESKGNEAVALFGQGLNCAQAVLAPFAGQYGLAPADALRIAGAFGGGLRCGEVCGAASGGAMVVGLAHGQTQPGDLEAKQRCNEKTIAFMTAFADKNGALRCRDLLGYDNTSPEGRAEIKRLNLHHSVCDGLVRGAVELLEEQGY